MEDQYLKFSQALIGAIEFLTQHVEATSGPGDTAAAARNHLAAVKSTHAAFLGSLEPAAVSPDPALALVNEQIAKEYGIDLQTVSPIPETAGQVMSSLAARLETHPSASEHAAQVES